MDIAMPYRDGLDVLRQLKSEFPKVPVLMLSTYPDKQYAVRSLKLGAAGYLNKSADSQQMTSAIRKVAAGGLFITPTVAEHLASSIGAGSTKAVEAPLHERLSHREYQVFRLLATGRTVERDRRAARPVEQHREHLPRARAGEDRRAQRRGTGAVRGACGRDAGLTSGACSASPTNQKRLPRWRAFRSIPIVPIIARSSPMSRFDPYDADRPLMMKCGCGRDHTPPSTGRSGCAQQRVGRVVSRATSSKRRW